MIQDNNQVNRNSAQERQQKGQRKHVNKSKRIKQKFSVQREIFASTIQNIVMIVRGNMKKKQKQVDLEELQQEVLKEYEYKNLIPKAITDVDKIYNSLKKYCLKIFKGICDYKRQCPKFHVDWENVRTVSAEQFERNNYYHALIVKNHNWQEQIASPIKCWNYVLKNKNSKKIQSDIKERSIWDVVFIMDCTGSMEPWIDQARESIKAIINIFNKAVSQTQVRIAFVGYRDFKDQKHIYYHDFIMDIIYQYSRSQGGDDEAEDVAGGIEQELKLNFSKHPQSIACPFLKSDSPTLGKQYHNNEVEDDHEDKIQNGSFEKNYTSNNYFFCWNLNDSTDQMFEVMKQNIKNLEISYLETKDFANYVFLSMINLFNYPSNSKKFIINHIKISGTLHLAQIN